MTIKPFRNNVLVEPVVKKQILVADKASLCEYGIVKAIGEEVKTIKVGDKIGFLVWGIQELDVDGTKYFFVPETSDFILGVIHD